MPTATIPIPTHDMFTINNPYGYKLKVGHPQIQPLYERYKKTKGLSAHYPITDDERFDFEKQVIFRMKALQNNLLFQERSIEKST